MEDPISVAVIAAAIGAAASGAGSEAGKQAWSSLTALVRRTLHREPTTDRLIEAIQAAPGDNDKVQYLAVKLAEYAEADEGFSADLAAWLERTERVRQHQSPTTNIVAGNAVINGQLLQGRDFLGPLSLGPPAIDSPST